MQREILFRGKKVTNGEWIFGYFFETEVGCFIGPYNDEEQVIPETVGQFIDRKDNDHIRIFEGDILLSHAQDDRELLSVVTWNSCNSKFEGSPIVGNGIWIDKGAYREAGLFSLFTVIGNIHDNPELLKPL